MRYKKGIVPRKSKFMGNRPNHYIVLLSNDIKTSPQSPKKLYGKSLGIAFFILFQCNSQEEIQRNPGCGNLMKP
jgi:hypothetical protein